MDVLLGSVRAAGAVAVLATVAGSKPPVIVTTVVSGAARVVPSTTTLAVDDVTVTVVGTLVLTRFQLGALPVSVSLSVTVLCSPLTGVALLSVADEALTGPPAAILGALSETVLVPALMVAGAS